MFDQLEFKMGKKLFCISDNWAWSSENLTMNQSILSHSI